MSVDGFDIYNALDLNINSEGFFVDGLERTVLYERHGDLTVLARVERFVDRISQSEGVGFEVKHNRQREARLVRRDLARSYNSVKLAFQEYRDDITYSIRVSELFAAAKDLSLLSNPFEFGEPDERHSLLNRFNFELYNELIENLRKRCRGSRYRRRLREAERTAKRRVAKVLMWERAMFEWRSRNQFLVLCLGYRPEHRDTLTPKRLNDDIDRLLAARRYKRLMRSIGGYVAKLEEGDESGLHVHILIAYSPRIRSDIKLAKLIGEYWENVVTGGEGKYWNSNAQKHMHRTRGHGIGTGMINRYDTDLRAALRQNLIYLAKSDQNLKRKTSAKSRLIRMSEVPKKLVTGRPRTIRSN